MAVHIKELIDKIKWIRDMADGAVSFKSKCRATRANSVHLWEFLYDLEDLEEDHASTLEEPLKVVRDVVVKAEQFVKDHSQLGWLQEFWTMGKVAFEVCELEREFMHAQRGAIIHPFLHKSVDTTCYSLKYILLHLS